MSDPLSQFDPPARWNDFLLDGERTRRLREAWSAEVAGFVAPAANATFYDPLTTRIGDAKPEKVEWTAFPKDVEDAGGDLATADQRLRQKEYCEWCVARNAAGRIVRVEFTSELPEYWEKLWETSEARVLELYRQMVSPRVEAVDLKDTAGRYRRANKWNSGGEYRPDEGGLVHLVVGINTLSAAVGVVAGASGAADDAPVGGQQFHADPLIGLAVKRVVHRLSARISFSNPVGIYLQEPQFHRFELPAAAPRSMKPQDCWRVTRGNRHAGQALHAVFEAPAGSGFIAGDVRIDGQLLEHGSQIARTLKSGTFVTPIPR